MINQNHFNYKCENNSRKHMSINTGARINMLLFYKNMRLKYALKIVKNALKMRLKMLKNSVLS